MIVTLTNQKGGCGKSTMAMNLGLSTAALGYNMVLIDAEMSRKAVSRHCKITTKPILKCSNPGS